MKLRTIACMSAVMLFLTLSSSPSASAFSTLTLSPAGNAGYVLQGSEMDSVAAMDITITYDAATLANPRVVQGGLIAGAVMAVNPNVRGAVRMGIITTSPIRGAGTIASLTFNLVGSAPGRIIAISARLSNSKGTPLPAQTKILNVPSESATGSTTPSDAGAQSGTIVPSTAPTPAGGGQVIIGGGVVPSAESAATVTKEPSPVPEAMPEPAKENVVISQETTTDMPAKDQAAQSTGQDKKIYTQKSVLVRFREYKGEQSIQAFTELFNHEPLIGFRQEPPIVLSDGKATFKISFIAMQEGNKTPDVKLKGATLVSLKKDPDNTNTWIAELRPEKQAVSAALVVSQEKVTMEFPIITAPEAAVDLNKVGGVTEEDFKFFLSVRGTAQKPQFDLNGDGKRDVVDDYIFTANYLVKMPQKK